MFSNYRNSHQPSQYKRISQKGKLLCSDYRNYVYIKITHLPIKFNSSIVKSMKKGKIKAVCARITTMVVVTPSLILT